jgi:4-diphosphocytidyl-2-C-methyl-D-erythritol kinase
VGASGAAIVIVRALAPAKLNLGLEILGRRADGFHEIRTILAAVSLFDRITVQQSEESTFHVDDPDLATELNIVQRAMGTMLDIQAKAIARVTLQKRIPAAAGLGGASSDAAAAMIAIDQCFVLNVATRKLLERAADLGSDVPFFIAGGRALATGRGEMLNPLPPLLEAYAIIVAPEIRLEAKTKRLYGALIAADFTDGHRMETAARKRFNFDAELHNDLRNAFERPLYDLVPDLRSIPGIMQACGATVAALSGAGPAHYAIDCDLERAHDIASRLRTQFKDSCRVHVVRFLTGGVVIDSSEDPLSILADLREKSRQLRGFRTQ